MSSDAVSGHKLPEPSMADQSRPDDIAASHARKRRARLVCVLCHDRKVKCDLQDKTGPAPRSCTNCAVAEYHCSLRPSKRSKHARSVGDFSSPESHGRASLLPLLHGGVTSPTQLPTPGGTTLDNRGFSNRQPEHSGNATALERYQDAIREGHRRDDLKPLNGQASEAFGPQLATKASRHMGTPHENHSTLQTSTEESYLGDTGFIQLFSQERGTDAANALTPQIQKKDQAVDLPPPALQESFAETYLQYCYPWCPVVDKQELRDDLGLAHSPLLVNALALAGSQIQPPVIKHATSSVYYDRAKRLFYSNEERNPITCLKGIILFYWWSPNAPNTFTMDSVFWWTGVAIRQAQQLGLHREPKSGQQMRGGVTQGLKRRIWWTLFARERLTGICQGRPCIIDPEDCNVRDPSLDDFPEPRDIRAEIFIYWVRLCGIIGRVGKYLLRTTESSTFPNHLAIEFIDWVDSLPEQLRLPIAMKSTTTFSRDVHQLHLPYLTTIIILHLNRSPRSLPKAYTAAVLAASCVARIFEDYLARGHIRFLTAITCWYVAVAILALLHARQVDHLAKTADDDIRILQIALKELGAMWPSAKMFDRGFERLRGSNAFSAAGAEGDEAANTPGGSSATIAASGLVELCMSSGNGVDWMRYFPYVTTETSALASILLAGNQKEPLLDLDWPTDFTLMLQDIFDPSGTSPDAIPLI